MRKSLAGAVGVAAALSVLFGASANANPFDPYAGQTYADVAAAISNGGGTAVIATRVGEYLPTDQCIVSGSRNSNGKVLLDLNCNDAYAGKTGHSGNSAATPEGRKINQQMATAKSIDEDFANANAAGAKSWCEENLDSCTNFCKQTEMCSAEVNQFVGL